MRVKPVHRPGDMRSSVRGPRTITVCDRLPVAGPEDFDVTTSQTAGAALHRRRTPSGGTAVRRTPAQRAPELAPLALDELRAYRQELIAEESRVSYWRRILQARLDLVIGDETSLDRLRTVLSEHQQSSRRLAMLPPDGAAGLPPLPDLAVLWQTENGGDADGTLVASLEAAERELSTYRRSLHDRLDAATGELISRYRDEPALALRALPLPRTAECGVA